MGVAKWTSSQGAATALGRAPVQRNGGGVSALASGRTRAGGRSTGVSKGMFDGVARGLGCAPGSPILCLVPFSSLPARLARSSKQPAAWLHYCYAKIWRGKWAAPSGALGGSPARDVSTFCCRRPPLPSAAAKEDEHARPHRRDEESAAREQRRGEGARFPACRSR
jgi:hypothetical protein